MIPSPTSRRLMSSGSSEQSTTISLKVAPEKATESPSIFRKEKAFLRFCSASSLMLTNPNTLGIFETHIEEIAQIVHRKGGLIYMDGANFNALMGYARPGEMGIDVLHLNLHKTLSTPHGGGGPGSGPVACKKDLAPYLPVPRVEQKGGQYRLNSDEPASIGRVHAFYGNFGMAGRPWPHG